MKRIPCKCGHSENQHFTKSLGYCYPIWQDLKSLLVAHTKPCMCIKYSADNLSYIEALAKQKGLV